MHAMIYKWQSYSALMYEHLNQFKDAISRNAVMNDLFVFRRSHCHQLEDRREINALPAFIPTFSCFGENARNASRRKH
jgi:hypothetical protein